jgi:DNA-binding GntR family transcriptional regulator
MFMARSATMTGVTLAAIAGLARPAGDSGRGGVSEYAYSLLRRAIIETVLKPGAALSEAEVALKVGVSRTPVREAFRRLSVEKLLVVSPQVGTSVSRLSRPAIVNALFVRNALECAAVGRAVDAPVAHREALIRIVQRQQVAIACGDVEDNLAQDEAFHRTIMTLSGHIDAWPLVQQARDQLERLRRIAIPELRGNEDAARQHAAIAEAIVAGNAIAAQKLLATHIFLVETFIDPIQAAHPDYFESAT